MENRREGTEGTEAGNGGGGWRKGADIYHLRRTTEFRHLLQIYLVKPHMRHRPTGRTVLILTLPWLELGLSEIK